MRNRGITLFIAVVVMSILLFISFAVVNIAVKSSLFSNSGRDSEYAFYAADAGLECAFYWDSKFDSFATSTSGGIGSPVECDGMAISNGSSIPGRSEATLIGGAQTDPLGTSIFYFDMNRGSEQVSSCAIVTVEKTYSGSPLVLKTHIKSRGYNTCDTSNSRRVERGIEVTY